MGRALSSGAPAITTPRAAVGSHQGERTYVSHSVLPNGGCLCGGHELQRRHRTNLSILIRVQTCTRGVRLGFVEALHSNAGRDLDNKAVGGGEEGVGQG